VGRRTTGRGSEPARGPGATRQVIFPSSPRRAVAPRSGYTRNASPYKPSTTTLSNHSCWGWALLGISASGRGSFVGVCFPGLRSGHATRTRYGVVQAKSSAPAVVGHRGLHRGGTHGRSTPSAPFWEYGTNGVLSRKNRTPRRRFMLPRCFASFFAALRHSSCRDPTGGPAWVWATGFGAPLRSRRPDRRGLRFVWPASADT